MPMLPDVLKPFFLQNRDVNYLNSRSTYRMKTLHYNPLKTYYDMEPPQGAVGEVAPRWSFGARQVGPEFWAELYDERRREHRQRLRSSVCHALQPVRFLYPKIKYIERFRHAFTRYGLREYFSVLPFAVCLLPFSRLVPSILYIKSCGKEVRGIWTPCCSQVQSEGVLDRGDCTVPHQGQLGRPSWKQQHGYRCERMFVSGL